MTFWIIAATLILLAAMFYSVALLIVWTYELKAEQAYRTARRHLEILENAGLMGAVAHARMFKVQQDYRRMIAEITRKRQFILENLMFKRKFVENRKKCSYVLE